MANPNTRLDELFLLASRTQMTALGADRQLNATLVAGDQNDHISIPVSLSMSRPARDRLVAFLANGNNRFVVSSSDGALSVRISMVIARSSSTQELVPHLGNAAIDWDRGAIERDGRRAALSRTELRLLACLLEHAGATVTHDALIASAWTTPPDDAGYNALAVYVCYLRRSLKSIGLGHALHTVRGVGYALSVDAPHDTASSAPTTGARGRPKARRRRAGDIGDNAGALSGRECAKHGPEVCSG